VFKYLKEIINNDIHYTKFHTIEGYSNANEISTIVYLFTLGGGTISSWKYAKENIILHLDTTNVESRNS